MRLKLAGWILGTGGVLAASIFACGGDDNTQGGGGGHDGGEGIDAPVPPPSDGGLPDSAPPPQLGAVVAQHHNNPSRDGVYVDPTLTKAAAATVHIDATFTGTLTGQVYAQPLWVEKGPGGNEAFIVATEQNHVTALDATGKVVWDKTFGAPVPLSGLPCGNIDPLGISGTPYLDLTSRTIYFDAMTTGPKHKVYAIALDDGSTKSGWPVDMDSAVSGFNSAHQNERGAVQLVNGTLYVPYGGHDGDCDPYKGVVVAISTSDPTKVTSWSTMAGRGGIWGPGSLPSDGTSVFPVTGNTEGTSTWGGGEAVIRLGAGATFSGNKADYYAPSNWKSLDDTDLDLGGASNFLFDMPGAPVPHLVAAPGKDQNIYVMNRDNLGGIGAELIKAHVATGELNGAGAAYHTSQGTYLALHVSTGGGNGMGCPVGGGGNLVVVKITAGNPPTAAVAWCNDEGGIGSPMVTTTDGMANAIVWDANDHLWAYDGDTGAKIFDGSKTQMGGSMQYFNTPMNAKGRIAVAIDSKLVLLKP